MMKFQNPNPSSTKSQQFSINPGLNLTMSTQNSISLKTPSPSKSPSLIIPLISSSSNPSSPILLAFLFRLSSVITLFSSSINSRNPLQSSVIRDSPPSFSAMIGSMSWN
ncbi:hypothetical protein Droror1_Dr00014958 [Drosera rotundifolia]